MKVLVLAPDAYGGRGGVALYNQNILRALCQHPARPKVSAVVRAMPYAPDGVPEGLDFRASSGSKPSYVLDAMKLLAEHRRFDLVIVTHINLLPVAAAIRLIAPAPLMLFVYGLDVWTRPNPLIDWLVKGVEHCIAIRQESLDRMNTWADLRGTRQYILENAIDLDRYGRSSKRRDLVEKYGLDGRTVLLTLSRLDDPHFGVDEVLEVLPDLVSEMPRLTYLVVGDGTEMARIRAKASQLGVGDHVVFAGFVDDSEKADHLRLGDAFAMPGSEPDRFDRYPLRFVFLEAMACGLPVVASRPEEIGTPIPNIYVDPHDREDLKAGLRKALAQGVGDVPEELAQYDFAAFRTRLHAIVDEVMDRRRPS